ncbi:hypothetical protein AOLI_G00206090 [Acnodon oligacanthus]
MGRCNPTHKHKLAAIRLQEADRAQGSPQAIVAKVRSSYGSVSTTCLDFTARLLRTPWINGLIVGFVLHKRPCRP